MDNSNYFSLKLNCKKNNNKMINRVEKQKDIWFQSVFSCKGF